MFPALSLDSRSLSLFTFLSLGRQALVEALLNLALFAKRAIDECPSGDIFRGIDGGEPGDMGRRAQSVAVYEELQASAPSTSRLTATRL